MASSSTSKLSGKRAFVTGASSGIGRAIAVALAEHGADVVVCARRQRRLAEVVSEIESAGGSACGIVADFTDEAKIIDAISAGAEAEGGGLDILVNSAGLARQASLVDGEYSDWADMMNLNVLGLATACREALKFFPDTGGQILNLCSMSGHRVPGRGGFYSATKFAVRAMTEGLRQELRLAGNHTRVSCISPGFVDTELLDEYFASASSPLSRDEAIKFPILKAEDIAALAIHQLTAPEHVDITDVLLRPTHQAV